MGSEDDRFQAYRDKPGRDTLRALLSAHQAAVFNLCFQVLRSEADAEDAAQETLLEIVRGVDKIREPRAFKRWTCRVALHTALDHLRRRHRRARHEETRAAMKPAMPDPSADAIHEALAKLEDEDRCLLVEKYFERATLEEIAAREGVTAAAVGKRVDRAKERLKQRLSQAGLAAFVPGVDSMLESSRPVTTAPPLNLDLALAGAPGVILTVKAAAILALVLLMGAGGAYAWKRNSRKDVIAATPSSASIPVGLKGAGEIATSEVA
ncbi:MAG TPA: sigma-70 family RNA polymerase sigma factor, partial [Planctomycetota bacterium]|nr:sigma-70 family RNA polymerase sigma factor [Planctomycetota bacterium]